MSGQPAVSVIINAHHEGPLAHRSVRSAGRAADYAREQGVAVELIAVLDCPDEATLAYFQSQAERFVRVETVDVDDLGHARNHGARCARGQYLCFLDADDLFSENWILAAYRFAESHPHDKLALHPELNLYFGDGLALMPHADSTSAGFNPLSLLQYNYWTALVFMARPLFAGHEYSSTDLKRGFGYEDWHFNCETLAAGIQHRPVPGTVHFIRRKPDGSQSQRTLQTRGLMPPSRLFDAPQLASSDNRARASGTLRSIPATLQQMRRLGWWHARCPEALRPPLTRMVKFALRTIYRFRNPLPHWLLAEWNQIHEIEPELVPCRRAMAAIQPVVIPASRVAPYYESLCTAYGTEATHVVLLSGLAQGGAYRTALDYIEAIVEASPSSRVVCITTERTPSPRLAELPAQVRVVELGRQLHGLGEDDQQLLLTRLLLQKRPSVIHCVDLPLGYQMLATKGAALASQSRLFVSVFGDQGESVGQPGRVAVDALWRYFKHLSGVFTAQATCRQRLIDVYALDPDKLIVADHRGRAPGALPLAQASGRHSPAAFLATLRAVPGYLVSDSPAAAGEANTKAA